MRASVLCWSLLAVLAACSGDDASEGAGASGKGGSLAGSAGQSGASGEAGAGGAGSAGEAGAAGAAGEAGTAGAAGAGQGGEAGQASGGAAGAGAGGGQAGGGAAGGGAAGGGQAKGYLALVGGGSEDDPGVTPSWSAAAYGWIVERAKKGKVAIVASTPQSTFLPDYFKGLGAEDAYNVTIADQGTAQAEATQQALAQASAIFLKGGDQAKYLTAFAGTAVQKALVEGFAQGKVLAGTSAGAHVLSEVIYDAKNGGVYPEEALRDPYIKYVTFTEGFLGVLPGTLVDTHFTTRGRLARLPAFLARLAAEQPGRDLLGIGLDERTALLVEPDGRAAVVGRGAVTLLRRTASSKALAKAGEPPLLTDVAMDVLTEGYTFDLTTRAVVEHPASAEPIGPQSPPGPPSAPLTLDGSSSTVSSQGSGALGGVLTDVDAYRKGTITLDKGLGKLPGALVVGRLFHPDELDFIENRFGGAIWALGRGPAYAVMIDDGGSVSVDAQGAMTAPGGPDEPASLVIDARAATERAASPYTPQQGAALLGARLHLLRSGAGWQP